MLPYVDKPGMAGFTRAEKWIVLSSVYCTSRAHLSGTGWPVADYFSQSHKKETQQFVGAEEVLHLFGAGEGALELLKCGCLHYRLDSGEAGGSLSDLCKCPTSFSSDGFSQCGSRVSTSRASLFFSSGASCFQSLSVSPSFLNSTVVDRILRVRLSPYQYATLNLRQRILCDCTELTRCLLVLAK